MEPIANLLSGPAIVALAALAGLAILAFAGLRGWQGWLALKERELEHLPTPPREIEGRTPAGGGRIEIADLKERVRRLEAIAAGVDL